MVMSTHYASATRKINCTLNNFLKLTLFSKYIRELRRVHTITKYTCVKTKFFLE